MSNLIVAGNQRGFVEGGCYQPGVDSIQLGSMALGGLGEQAHAAIKAELKQGLSDLNVRIENLEKSASQALDRADSSIGSGMMKALRPIDKLSQQALDRIIALGDRLNTTKAKLSPKRAALNQATSEVLKGTSLYLGDNIAKGVNGAVSGTSTGISNAALQNMTNGLSKGLDAMGGVIHSSEALSVLSSERRNGDTNNDVKFLDATVKAVLVVGAGSLAIAAIPAGTGLVAGLAAGTAMAIGAGKLAQVGYEAAKSVAGSAYHTTKNLIG